MGRNERWVELSNKKFSGVNGFVELNTFGKWDAVVVFQTRPPLNRKGQPKKEQAPRPWRRTTKHCGEWKRPREAMIAVESAAAKMKAENNPDRLF